MINKTENINQGFARVGNFHSVAENFNHRRRSSEVEILMNKSICHKLTNCYWWIHRYFLAQCLSYFLALYSVPERDSWCTEYAFGAKKRASGVRDASSEAFGVKTGFYGTEEIFGAKKGLLVYGAQFIQRHAAPETAS